MAELGDGDVLKWKREQTTDRILEARKKDGDDNADGVACQAQIGTGHIKPDLTWSCRQERRKGGSLCKSYSGQQGPTLAPTAATISSLSVRLDDRDSRA